MAEPRRRKLALAGAFAVAVAAVGLGVWSSGPSRETGRADEPRAGARTERAPARRIVSLAPSHTEILFALGAGEQVVAVTEADDFPPAAAELPRVGGMTTDTLDLERVVAARPDVVVALALDQEEPVARLRRLGLRVEVIPAASLGDLFDAVRRMGQLSGRPEAAESLARELEARVEGVRRAVAGAPAAERPRVFYQIWDRPLMTAGPESFVGELIETARGRNVFHDVGSLYPRVSPEAVIRRDPEVILAPDHHGEPVTAETLAARPGWEAIRAVRRRRVHTIDGDLVSRPGPRVVRGLEIIAQLLHPEIHIEVHPERFPPRPAPEERRP